MKQILTVLIALGFFALQACEGPAGPAGAQGAAGKDGATGKDGVNAGFVYFDGFKADLKCASCHSADTDTVNYLISRRLQWEQSTHATRGNFDRNAANCAGCHTTEGFLDRAKMNFSTQFATSNKPNGSPQGCFACHAPHGRGDFSKRDTSGVTLTNVFVGGLDKAFDGGSKSNLCVKCHLPRNVSAVTPAPNVNWLATDTATISTSRWYQHYTIQPQMFLGTEGNGGFQFPGYTYDNTYHKTLAQQKSLGCVDCHMQDPIGGGTGKAGGHTMKVSYLSGTTKTYLVYACRTCHTDITANTMTSTAFYAYKSGAVNTIKAKLKTLADLMMDSTITKKWNLGGTNKVWLTRTIDAATGDTSYTSTATTSSPIKIKPAIKAGALWNFSFIEHDKSKGMHNFKYANTLLDASIAELKK